MEKPIDFWLRKGKAVGETKPTETKRKVPTLRNQRKHRTKQGDLWGFYGLSVASSFNYLCFYNNTAKIFGMEGILHIAFEPIAFVRSIQCFTDKTKLLLPAIFLIVPNSV